MKLYVIEDCGGQGMNDNGVLAVLDEAEYLRQKNELEEEWYIVHTIELNEFYSDGISSAPKEIELSNEEYEELRKLKKEEREKLRQSPYLKKLEEEYVK